MREEVIKVVSVLDPALDTEAMTVEQLREYATKRADYRTLKYKPNELPTVFHVKEIEHRLMESWVLEDADNEAQVQRRCFQASVVKVENLYQRDGVRLPEWSPRNDKGDAMIIPDESLERFSLAERIEIGQVAWDHSFLHPRIEPTYRLPLMSATSLARRGFLPAGASQSEQATSSDAASSDSVSAPPQQPPTESGSSESGECSGSATGATAEATA